MPDAAPQWSDQPVICEGCCCARMPVMTEDGWRMPVHQLSAATWPAGTGLCLGALALVAV